MVFHLSKTNQISGNWCSVEHLLYFLSVKAASLQTFRYDSGFKTAVIFLICFSTNAVVTLTIKAGNDLTGTNKTKQGILFQTHAV